MSIYSNRKGAQAQAIYKVCELTPLPAVFITHDITEAVFLADRVLLMSRRPGTIAHTFPVSLPRPRTLERRFEPRFTGLCHDIHQAMGLLQQGALQEVLSSLPPGEA